MTVGAVPGMNAETKWNYTQESGNHSSSSAVTRASWTVGDPICPCSVLDDFKEQECYYEGIHSENQPVVMCQHVCCALHALWGIIYTGAGSVQLVAGIFFLLSLPIFKIGSNIWTGACNVLIGVGTFMLSCFGDLNRSRYEKLLLLTLAALILNVANLVVLEVGEWYLFMTEQVRDTIERKNLHDLAFYARVSTSVTTAIVILVALVDSQLTFCSMQMLKKSSLRHQNNNETVSDIEYIIPRNKTRSLSSQKTHSVNPYTQSWVFDAETGTSSLNESPGVRLYPTAPIDPDAYQQDQENHCSTPVVTGVVTVQVDDTSEHCGDGDRQINHMKSFSRTPSPAEASQSSSSSSIPPIYECLERLTQPTVYRSRLSSYRNVKDFSGSHGARSRVQSGDKEHYASLMVELENSFMHKKETKTTVYTVPPSSTSKSSTLYSTSLCNESLTDTIDSRQRGSDAEFSKELEAALKLIQDLESPNTIDTPSETCKAVAEDCPGKRRRSHDEKNDSDSTKTLSGSSSIDTHGKKHKNLPVESQSTSGYNSPSLERSSRLTPSAEISTSDLTVSQENGLSCVIRHLGDTAVISLFSPSKKPHPYSSADKVSDIVTGEKELLNGLDKDEYEKRTMSLNELKLKSFDSEERSSGKGKIRKWRHLIERKRRPSLLPEVESAIVKSESLAFLSKSELKDRLNQTKSIHRQIEAKVHRQRSLRKADSFGSVEDIIDRYGVSTCL